MNEKEIVLIKYSGKIDCFDQLVPDLGIAYLMASLEQANIKTKFFDLNLWHTNKSEVIEYIQVNEPLIVGFKIENIGKGIIEIINLANEIKKISNSKLIAGGPTVQLFEDICLKLKEFNVFDGLVYGEGEKSIVDLYNAYYNNEDSLEEVPNLIYKDGDIIKKTRWELFDFSDLMITWNGINLKDYLPILPINMKRGCENACSFCSHSYLWGKLKNNQNIKILTHKQFKKMNTVRLRYWDSILQELENDYYYYGVRNLYIVDSTPNIALLNKLADYILNNQLNVNWFAFGRFDSFDKSTLNKFRNSGLNTLYFGWESGDEKILKLMHKGITVDKMKKTYSVVKDLDIKVAGSFIVGHPGEDLKSFKNTLSLIKSLKLTNYSISAFRLTPGSYISANPTEYGIKLYDNWKEILLRAHVNGDNDLNIDYYMVNGLKNSTYWSIFNDQLNDYNIWTQMRVNENIEIINLLAADTGIPSKMLLQVFMDIFDTKNHSEMHLWLKKIWNSSYKREVTIDNIKQKIIKDDK